MQLGVDWQSTWNCVPIDVLGVCTPLPMLTHRGPPDRDRDGPGRTRVPPESYLGHTDQGVTYTPSDHGRPRPWVYVKCTVKIAKISVSVWLLHWDGSYVLQVRHIRPHILAMWRLISCQGTENWPSTCNLGLTHSQPESVYLLTFWVYALSDPCWPTGFPQIGIVTPWVPPEPYLGHTDQGVAITYTDSHFPRGLS